MGVLTPWSAHARPSARPPIDTNGNFSAHMSGGGGNCLTVFLINFLAKSENSKHFSFFSKKNLKILGGGNFQNVFLINFLAKSGNSKHFSFFSFFSKKN